MGEEGSRHQGARGVLAEGLSSVPSTHFRWLTAANNSSSQRSGTFWSLWKPVHIQCTQLKINTNLKNIVHSQWLASWVGQIVHSIWRLLELPFCILIMLITWLTSLMILVQFCSWYFFCSQSRSPVIYCIAGIEIVTIVLGSMLLFFFFNIHSVTVH